MTAWVSAAMGFRGLPPLCALLVLLLPSACAASEEAARSNHHEFGPVIGILAQPLDSHAPGSYIEGWYTKWLEAHGARIVPLRYDAPSSELEHLMARVNGVLFPGGGAAISEHSHYGRASAKVFRAALRAGMPVWGTCLGFQQLLLYSSGQSWPGPVSFGWDSEGLFLPINFTASASQVASLLEDWPDDLLEAAASKPWSWHLHQHGVSTEDFARNPELGKFWNVLATNYDRTGREFISLVQAKNNLPFYASQFHPEKNALEFEIPKHASVSGKLQVHSGAAIAAMNRFASFFVDQTRSFRSFGFSAKDFWKWSIASWPVHIAERLNGTEWLTPHMPVYYFPPWASSESTSSAQTVPTMQFVV